MLSAVRSSQLIGITFVLYLSDNCTENVSALKDVSNCVSQIESTDIIAKTSVENIMLGTGKVCSNNLLFNG